MVEDTPTATVSFRSERWLSLRDASEVLGMHYQTVGDLWRSEVLPGVKGGDKQSSRVRVPIEAVHALAIGDHATLALIRKAIEQGQNRKRVRRPRAAQPAKTAA